MEAFIALDRTLRVPAGIQSARAALELAAGRPILVRGEGAPELTLAGEHLTPERLEVLRQAGAPVLLLSPRRAATLRLAPYTEEAVALAIEPGWTARFVLSLVDPAQDAAYAPRGPLTALREPLAPARAAAIHLVQAAGLMPAAAVARLAAPVPDGLGFLEIAAEDGLAPSQNASAEKAELVASARLPLAPAIDAELIGFRLRAAGLWGGSEAFVHYALAIGRPAAGTPPLVRLHSECFTGDFLGSLKCDCGDQLRGAVARLAEEGGGYLLYLRQEGRGIGLLNKVRAYHLQDQGLDTVEANERLGFADDARSYAPAARMLEVLGAAKIRLLTNNPRKVEGLVAEGIEVAERVGHRFPANPHNADYLATKAAKSGHLP